jgi:Sulfotransferase family
VFILCSARSYSSVVTAMIGQHPELYGFPELKLFAYPTLGELAASLPEEARRAGFAHRSPGLVRALAELLFGGQSLDALEAACAWLAERPEWRGEAVFDLLMAKIHPRRAVEKSPEHVAESEPLQRLASAYVNARFIHLVRHPVATINSMHEHLRAHLHGYDHEGLVQYCVSSWLDTHARIVEFARRVSEDRILQVRAEDVLNDSLLTVARIASWLGVRTDEHAIDAMLHPERSPYAGFAPADSGVSGGGDPAFLSDPRPHSIENVRTLELPSRWSIRNADRDAIERAGVALGYP